MGLTKQTRGDLGRELKNLKIERLRLEKTIVSLETILASTAAQDDGSVEPTSMNTSPARRRARSRRRSRKRVKSTQVIAALLRHAGKPLSPQELTTLASERGEPFNYETIYGALRKSPLFIKIGMKWFLKDAAHQAGHAVDSSVGV